MSDPKRDVLKSERADAPPPGRGVSPPLSRPLFTWVFLGLIVLIWLVMTAAGGSENSQVLVRFGMKVNPLIVMGQYWRLLTAMFLHIGLAHLGFNGYALYILGQDVERVFGHVRFLIIYLLAGLFGNLASFAFNPNPSAGASGAIFGLIGAMGVFWWRYRDAFGPAGRRQLYNVVAVVVINLALGLGSSGIDNWGHGGGLLSGAALGWLLGPRYVVMITPQGRPLSITDTNSLGRRWWVVPMAVAVLVGGVALAVAVQSGSPEVHFVQANRYLATGDYPAAVREFKAGLERDPTTATGWFGLGLAYSRQEDHASAATAYEQAVRLQPDLAPARRNLGYTYVLLGRRQEAIDQLQKFITLSRDGEEKARAQAVIAELEDGG